MDKIFDLTSDKHLQIICMKNLDLDDMCDMFIWHCIVNIILWIVIQSNVLWVMLNSQSIWKNENLVIL